MLSVKTSKETGYVDREWQLGVILCRKVREDLSMKVPLEQKLKCGEGQPLLWEECSRERNRHVQRP